MYDGSGSICDLAELMLSISHFSWFVGLLIISHNCFSRSKSEAPVTVSLQYNGNKIISVLKP
jgi:hypothetical protein